METTTQVAEMFTSYTADNGKVHIARELLTGEQAHQRLSESAHWDRGAVITACRKSLAITAGEVAIPGHEVTCGNCKRAK
jgi:hypothetical protein